MSATEEEVDYMSDDFLVACVGNNDIRPGLAYSHSGKRKLMVEKMKKEKDETHRKKTKTFKEIQDEKLKEGMNTALDSSNKGFAMMAKMGFKAGSSLGKSGGVTEPIAVELKHDRVGLGWQKLLKEKKKKYEKSCRENRKEFDPLSYRIMKSNEYNEKFIQKDLIKSQRSCYDLDSKEGILEPVEYWFWPDSTWDFENEGEPEEENDIATQDTREEGEKDAENTEDDSKKCLENLEECLNPSDQLEVLTSYLRSTYIYCLWCSTTFEDISDLQTNCPGSTRNDHI